jgi:hypothetical protein
MLSLNLREIILYMKDVTIQTLVAEIKLHFEVFHPKLRILPITKNIKQYDLKTYVIFIYNFIIGIFYLGLARLYERTRDNGIAQVIETSYFAMLSRVSFLRLLINIISAIDLYRK